MSNNILKIARYFINETNDAEQKLLETKQRESLDELYFNIDILLKESIEREDIDAIFDIEHLLSIRNDNFYGEQENRVSERRVLANMRNLFHEALDTDKLKETLTNESQGKLPSMVPMKDPFFNGVKRFKAHFSTKILEIKSEKEKELLRTRRDAFECMKVKYENCIRKVLDLPLKSFKPRHLKKENELER